MTYFVFFLCIASLLCGGEIQEPHFSKGGIQHFGNKPLSFYPETNQDIIDIIHLAKKNQKKIRCVGSTHSLNPCAITSDYMIVLDRMNQVLEVGEDYCIVQAGMKVRELCIALEKEGLTLPVLGAIAEQTIAGAVATGTRGQVPKEGSMGSIVTYLEVIDGQGRVHEYSLEETPDKLHAAVTSLGLFGVVTKLKVKCIPLYLMAETIQRLDMETILSRLDEFLEYDKFVMYWNIDGEEVKVVTGHRIDCHFPPKTLAHFEMLGQYPHMHTMENFPPTLQRMAKSWQIHTLLEWTEEKAERLNRKIIDQKECIYQGEYAITREHLVPFLEEVRHFFRSNRHRLELAHDRMVLEIRPVKRDEVWFSPSYQQDVISFCFHDFKRGWKWSSKDADPFIEFENRIKKYNPRPHLGKAHFFSPQDLEKAFPRWKDFLNLRQVADPDQLFVTPYFEKLLFEGWDKPLDR